MQVWSCGSYPSPIPSSCPTLGGEMIVAAKSHQDNLAWGKHTSTFTLNHVLLSTINLNPFNITHVRYPRYVARCQSGHDFPCPSRFPQRFYFSPKCFYRDCECTGMSRVPSSCRSPSILFVEGAAGQDSSRTHKFSSFPPPYVHLGQLPL